MLEYMVSSNKQSKWYNILVVFNTKNTIILCDSYTMYLMNKVNNHIK